MTYLLNLAALGSVVLALLGAYPGVLADLRFAVVLLSPLWLPVLAIGGVIVLIAQSRSTGKKPVPPDLDPLADETDGGKGPAPHRRWFNFSMAILIVSLLLILTGMPRRVAFLISVSAFRRHIEKASVSRYGGEAQGRKLGGYHVDRYAADPRGGVYFRTHAGPDGIGPDEMIYGFAYRPNREGSPFGKAGYELSHMAGDWCCFSASNDN